MAAVGLRPGESVAGYTIERLLGEGGMGSVYLATHARLNRKVALKVLVPRLAEDPTFRERFILESEHAASLEHPNVVTIYDADERDGVLFIAMRYVEGTDLRRLLHGEGTLTPERTVELLTPVASALDKAHASGLVHRDVKPANILVAQPDGHVYLTDFGVAKRGGAGGLTEVGSFVGTVDYCAPEQIRGDELDGRADVYALGCVAYHCLAGQPPYAKDSDVAVIAAHLNEPIPALSTVRPGLPLALDGVIATAMAKHREVRHATAGELMAALAAALGDVTRTAAVEPPAAPTVEVARDTDAPTRPGPERPSRRWIWIAAAVALLLALAGGAFALTALDGSPKEATDEPLTTTTAPETVPAADIAGHLDRVASRQRTLTSAVVSADANGVSLAPLKRAANAVANEVAKMQGFLSGVTVAQQDREARRALDRALADQLSYAQAVRDFPSERASFTGAQARTAISLAGEADAAYQRAARLDPTLPVMPLARADHVHLLDLVPAPKPSPSPVPQTKPVKFTSDDRLERCIATAAVVRCSAGPSGMVVQLQPGRSPIYMGKLGSTDTGGVALAHGAGITAPGGKIRCSSSSRGITCADVRSGTSFTLGDYRYVFSDGRSGGSNPAPSGYTGYFTSTDRLQRCYANDTAVTCSSGPSGQAVTLQAGSRAQYLGYRGSADAGGGRAMAEGTSFRTPGGSLECGSSSRGITCRDTSTGETFTIGDHYVVVDGVETRG